MVKIALCQTKVMDNMVANVENAYRKISRAAYNGAKIVALGEMFNCPYSGRYFSIYAEEEEKSRALKMLEKVSREWGIYIIGGSIPELDAGKVYNTSYVFNPEGRIIGKHRKIHLFDIEIENGINFYESHYLDRGDSFTIFDTVYGKMGLCICYDIRFPELTRAMVLNGARAIFVPAAFNMTTGPAHWELLFKSRAVDNQIYIAGISPARDNDSIFTAYGHSLLVNPWGDITARAGEYEDIIYGSIDFEFLEKVRRELPLLKHRRPEVYI